MERACRKVKAAIFLAGGIKQEVGSTPITSAFTKLYYSRASSHWLMLEILGQNHKGLSSVKRVKRNSGSEGGGEGCFPFCPVSTLSFGSDKIQGVGFGVIFDVLFFVHETSENDELPSALNHRV